MFRFLIFCFVIIFANNLGSEVIEHPEQETIKLLKQQIQESKTSQRIIEKAKSALSRSGKCYQNSNQNVEDPSLIVFMSFSLPEGVWISLSPSVEKVGGVFILNGIPNNSFKELSQKVLELKRKGVNAQIQLDPKLFEQYKVDHVPCFVVRDADHFDKICGNISLEYALDSIEKKGETSAAKSLKQKLQRGINE